MALRKWVITAEKSRNGAARPFCRKSERFTPSGCLCGAILRKGDCELRPTHRLPIASPEILASGWRRRRDRDQFYHDAKPAIMLISADRGRLFALTDDAAQKAPSVARFLREELERAGIVPEDTAVARLVTMGSEVKFIVHNSARVQSGRLVCPGETNDNRSISVLTPIGSALLGLGPGQSISWTETGKSGDLLCSKLTQGRIRNRDTRPSRPAPSSPRLGGFRGHGRSRRPRARARCACSAAGSPSLRCRRRSRVRPISRHGRHS